MITEEIDCGIDVERIRLATARLELAARLLSPAEAVALAALPRAEQRRRFFVHWTLKEAYLKARGLGLGVELDEVEFSVGADGALAVHFASALDDVPSAWQFWSAIPSREHLLGVALRTGSGPGRAIVLRRAALGPG